MNESFVLMDYKKIRLFSHFNSNHSSLGTLATSSSTLDPVAEGFF
jgi:hypothetical protein